MEIYTEKSGNYVTLHINGTIDTQSASQLTQCLAEVLTDQTDLTLDFSKTDYITSAGLRAILIARKKLGNDRMRITDVNDAIAEVFSVTGFSDMVRFSRKTAGLDNWLDMSFKAILKKRCEDSPNRTVFVYEEREYSWDDVDKASQIIADELYSAGVKKGSHVGICARNSINWVFAFFAVQKLGGIAVLVNFELKAPEISVLSEIGDITHLCYGMGNCEALASELYGKSNIKYCYDIGKNVDFTEKFGKYDSVKDKYSEIYNADDASVVIFTSGSTGRPKAVLSSSYNLISCMIPLTKEFRLTEADRNCAFLPMFHIFGFETSVVSSLLINICSYIPSSYNPDVLTNTIYKYRCTMFHSVPTMVLAMTKSENFSPKKVSSLRVSALGGSATTEAQMKYLMSLFPNNHFCNVYGMSENAAISVTHYEDSVEHITQTVGTPVENVEVQIRDVSTKEVLPYGKPGEVYIRSNTMIVCYYRLAPEKQEIDDSGWLATGDLGMFDENGYLHLVGRAKDLIIRGGENISPKEIAEAVAEYDGVSDVKVMGVPHEVLGEEVAAAIIMSPGKNLDEEKIREFLSDKLAKFKIPQYFVVMKTFPLLGSGKVDAINLKKQVMETIGIKQ